MAANKNQTIESKAITEIVCRLLKNGKRPSKMKGYPGMLMKIKERFGDFYAQAGMLMKNKPVIAGAGNVDENKGC